MASRKGINTSGHYVVSINATSFHLMYFEFKKIERSDLIILYIVFKTQRPSDTVFQFRVTSNSSQRL